MGNEFTVPKARPPAGTSGDDSAFQAMLKADAENVFCNSDEFGTRMIYTPLVGANIPVVGIIVDPPPEKAGATPRFQTKQIHINLPKSIITQTPVLDGDKITLTGVAQPYTIVEILDETDPGMWHVVVN